MNASKSILFTCALVLIAVSQWASADWRLDNENSTLNFISTKNNAIAEVHTFKQLSGGISAEGGVAINIDLASVNTNIEIRDKRMQEHLFETDKFASAKITTGIDATALKQLSPGEQKRYTVKMTLELHGKQKKIEATLIATALKQGAINVATLQPIILTAADFSLVGGIEKLQALAKLSAIDTAVPITANFIFIPAPAQK